MMHLVIGKNPLLKYQHLPATLRGIGDFNGLVQWHLARWIAHERESRIFWVFIKFILSLCQWFFHFNKETIRQMKGIKIPYYLCNWSVVKTHFVATLQVHCCRFLFANFVHLTSTNLSCFVFKISYSFDIERPKPLSIGKMYGLKSRKLTANLFEIFLYH